MTFPIGFHEDRACGDIQKKPLQNRGISSETAWLCKDNAVLSHEQKITINRGVDSKQKENQGDTGDFLFLPIVPRENVTFASLL